MSKRENLNKLKVNSLKEIARDQGIDIKKKKKEDLVREILTSQVPLIDLTPVTKSKEVLAECVSPATGENENLPPYNAVHYKIHDQSQIPTISFSDIYNFMILRPKLTGGSVNNFKGLDRAVKHFEAGHVQDISVSEITSTIIYISAKCQASMKKHQYQVYLCLSRNGQSVTNIHHGYCQCPVGLGQSCSHIGSLLFALSHIKPQESCTSKPCKWVVPKGRSKKPTGPLETLRSKADKTDADTGDIEDASFDPRHTTDREFDMNATLLQLRNLKDIFPSTGMSHLWNIPDDAPVAEREIEVETYEDPLEMASKALILSNENLPIPISIDENLSAYIEERTRDQRKCSLWTELHKGRITSSLFGAVLHAGPNPRSLVDQIIHGSSLQRYQTLPRPVQWGVDHEEEAIGDYMTLQNAVSDVTVEAAGLTIYPSHAFLGASSDGWICDKSMPLGNQRGVLEIKCPYSISNEIIVEKEVHELAGKEGFCLENTPEGPRLNRNHKYYAQIQGEMAIMGCPWGDFVVWTAAKDSNCFIERINFDSEFCTRMMPKLVEFFVHHILPFYKCTEN